MTHLDDQALIDACLSGQTEAFGQLVSRYENRIFHTLVCILGSREDAQDVAQEAFVQAFQKLETFRGDSAFYSWLFRIAVNASTTFWRRNRRHHVSVDSQREQDGREPADPRADAVPSHAIETAERQQLVRQALAQLTPDYRIALVMKEMDGLKYEEIARILECPLGTVRSRIHRGRNELREKLSVLLKES